MELSLLGLVVQAVGAGLLSLIFFYLSRGKGNRVLQAAGVGWLLLFVSLVLLAVLGAKGIPFEPSTARSTSETNRRSQPTPAACRTRLPFPLER